MSSHDSQWLIKLRHASLPLMSFATLHWMSHDAPPPSRRFPPPRRRKSVAWHPERRIRNETSVPSSANIHNISISIYHLSYSIYFNFRLQSTSRWLHYSSYPRGIWQCSGNCVQNWVFNSSVIKVSRLCQPSA